MARLKAKKEEKQVFNKGEKLHLEQLTWGALTWINIEVPTERETVYLAEHYPFHPLDLDDCLSKIQRSKLDEYKDYLFLVLHFPVFNKEARVITTSQISVFIGDNYLITLHKGDLKTLVKFFRECQIDDGSREDNFSQGAGYLLYRIIDRLVRDPDHLKLGGESRELSILFSDVQGFTSISEKLSPPDLVELLNNFLTEMTDIQTN